MYVLTHLDDDRLLSGFDALAARECRTTAELLAHIAEIDHRHLFLRTGFESMRAYCMHKLHLSEDAAAKRIQVARLARELPALFPAIADGRLHMGAVRTLAPHLTSGNVEEFIVAAADRTVGEIEVLLAHRFPQPEVLRLDDGISPQVLVAQQQNQVEHATWHAQPTRPIVNNLQKVRTKIAPLSPERYTMQVTLLAETHDLLRRVQELLGHAVLSGDVPQVLHRALSMLREHLEKQKFGASTRPRKPRPAGARRCIPAHVRRAVFERDSGKCAHVDKAGRRCASRKRLEFDHIKPVARGGDSTASNLRLVCRAHNLYEAERAFGREFIARKANRRWSAAP